MNENRREEIIMATLKLASQKGLGAVSMNMIAESIGIKKPSLYNHFKSKEELVEMMYVFLKNKAQEKTHTQMDLKCLDNKSAYEILKLMVSNYICLCMEENMYMFYKVIYSERAISKQSAQIMAKETQKMIDATEQILTLLQNKKLLSFDNIHMSALSFAMTIHGLTDFVMDSNFEDANKSVQNSSLFDNYIMHFCKQNAYKE